MGKQINLAVCDPQDLYITSNEEIKVGDWVYNEAYGVGKVIGFDGSNIISFKNRQQSVLDYGLSKIIATTNSKLGEEGIISIKQRRGLTNHYPTFKPLPTIPTNFIKSYCEKPIDKILVCYDEIKTAYEGVLNCLQINSDSTINIKSIKESWNREEIVVLLNKAYFEGYNQSNSKEFDKWIEQNL